MMKRVYWDSNCFISFLNGDEQGERLAGVMEMKDKGELQIVTSVMTIVEVLKLSGETSDRKIIANAFSEDSGIQIIELTRFLAEQSRDFIWEHSFDKHKADAIHLATALFVDRYEPLDEIHTFDKDLLKFSGDPSVPIPILSPTFNEYPVTARPLFGESGNPII